MLFGRRKRDREREVEQAEQRARDAWAKVREMDLKLNPPETPGAFHAVVWSTNHALVIADSRGHMWSLIDSCNGDISDPINKRRWVRLSGEPGARRIS